MRYQQIGLFSREQMSAMSDRTLSRKWSPGNDADRRELDRRRKWGLAQRHGFKLFRLRMEEGYRRAQQAASPQPQVTSPPPQPQAPASDPQATTPALQPPTKTPSPQAPSAIPASQPSTAIPAPRPPVAESIPQPPVAQSCPQPLVAESTPQPPAVEPSPQPPIAEFAPQPPVAEPSPQPPIAEFAPQPPVAEPSPRPAVAEAAARSAVAESAAQPQAVIATPEPQGSIAVRRSRMTISAREPADQKRSPNQAEPSARVVKRGFSVAVCAKHSDHISATPRAFPKTKIQQRGHCSQNARGERIPSWPKCAGRSPAVADDYLGRHAARSGPGPPFD
ncbi:hypothetical protein SAMN05421748_106306 [Paractinoplanes atraurantiacus]|uniref:Uncharacterized protein n=1 Tax=Paractinoplanes atraurantiacus TaxID=1036182 RepID=A0A285I3K2_9ACTN|nr:hypothetical protein SAMN05421748_106306 [Actinoplanes atraurantiacus]